MCLNITPRYGCGHKDQAWLLYCHPTRKICGRKHPPLEICSGKDIQKQEWHVFEPRCARCERRFRAGREKELKRMTRISSAPNDGPPAMLPLTTAATAQTMPLTKTSSSASGFGLSRKRRTGSVFENLKDLFRIDSGVSLGGGSKRHNAAVSAATLAALNTTTTTTTRTGSLADSDKASSDADSLAMLEMRRALPSVNGVDVEPGVARGLAAAWSSSSLDSLPCSPRTSMAPTPVSQD